ncbi:MAG: AmpG family muropeptide MFS transporter, partial [Rhodospirillales bacterium]|nr:AmpG family muropeptide MFS transporter [Rhodospirillales bacterium]
EILIYALLAQPPYLAQLYGALAAGLVWLVADLAVRLFGAGGVPFDSVMTPTWTMLLGFWIAFLAAVWAYGVPSFSRTALARFGLAGVGEERPLHAWTRRAIVEPFFDFFSRHGVATALLVLCLISLFKASDVVLTLMANPFYIEIGFDKTEIAWVSKTLGPWVTVFGGLVGGTIVYRLGLYRSMMLGVVVMAASNLMFALLATIGHDLRWFAATIVIENLSGGIGTAVFVAYLSSLCNLQYTAVQYALLTSFMQLFGKFVIVPSSGFYAEAVGWHWFFVTSTLFAVPALLLLWLISRRGFVEQPVDVPVAQSLTQPAIVPSR